MVLSGLDLSDEEVFCDKLEDVVTSVKRNGVAIKGKVYLLSKCLLNNNHLFQSVEC